MKGSSFHLEFESFPDDYTSLQDVISRTQKAQLSESQIGDILTALLKLIDTFQGYLYHLEPSRIFISEDFDNARIITGDANLFQPLDFGENLQPHLLLDKMDKLRFLSPEMIIYYSAPAE